MTMQPEGERLWQKLVATASFLDGAQMEHSEESRRRFIMGQFSASISTVQGSSNPVRMTASVGWADHAARQKHDFDETFWDPISGHFISTTDGGWVQLPSEEAWTDEEIVDWLLKTLGMWLKSGGRSQGDEDEEKGW